MCFLFFQTRITIWQLQIPGDDTTSKLLCCHEYTMQLYHLNGQRQRQVVQAPSRTAMYVMNIIVHVVHKKNRQSTKLNLDYITTSCSPPAYNKALHNKWLHSKHGSRRALTHAPTFCSWLIILYTIMVGRQNDIMTEITLSSPAFRKTCLFCHIFQSGVQSHDAFEWLQNYL